jgi:hypothetical protein
VRSYLNELGWPKPVLADSGNGYHLLYRVYLPAADGNIKRALHALAERFDDDHVKIERSVYNPSLLTKLYGTRACKGQWTQDRPHRWTQLLDIPTQRLTVPAGLLESLASRAPADQKPSTGAGETS